MDRLLIEKLKEWKESSKRKPLILNGARQVGKTWILEEFGSSYKDGFVRIDFDKQKDYKQFFEQSKDPLYLIKQISFSCGKTITVDTLLIFDEVQECSEALNSLKYFQEDAPLYHVIAAGSLLGLSLAKGFPVGKVDFLHLNPLSFKEFLLACDKKNLVEYLEEKHDLEPIPDLFFNQLNTFLKMYLVIGGMPEVVASWLEKESINKVNDVLESINKSYEMDFGKHTSFSDIQKIRYIWDSIPSQLSKENKKFFYSAAKPGARAREYESALMWLVNSEDLVKVSRINKPGIPISAYEDLTAFKMYFNDIGLLRQKSNIPVSLFLDNSELITEFKGAVTENYVLQELRSLDFNKMYYWTDSNHEVDFVLQMDEGVIPIECKSGNSTKSASFKYYLDKFSENTQFGIRYSMKNLSFDGKILNIPLCLACWTRKLVRIKEKTGT